MAKFILKELKQGEYDVFLNSGLQMGNILQSILESLGNDNDVIITSFSLAEEFIRKVVRLKKNNLVRNIKIVLDMKAAEKTATTNSFAKKVFDEILMTKNHSKLMLIKNNNRKKYVVVMSSQNQTRGNRLENYMYFESKDFNYKLLDELNNYVDGKL